MTGSRRPTPTATSTSQSHHRTHPAILQESPNRPVIRKGDLYQPKEEIQKLRISIQGRMPVRIHAFSIRQPRMLERRLQSHHLRSFDGWLTVPLPIQREAWFVTQGSHDPLVAQRLQMLEVGEDLGAGLVDDPVAGVKLAQCEMAPKGRKK